MSGIVNDLRNNDSIMDSEDRKERSVDIYISAETVRDMKYKDMVNFTQTPQHTGSDSVNLRSSRAAPVCLVLLYSLLLTAVIVLCVYIYTNNTNYTQERNQLLTNITKLTDEKDEILTRNTNLTEERDELLTRNTNLTEERDELLTGNNNLTEERDELLTNITILTEERNQLLTKITNLTEEKNQLIKKNLLNVRALLNNTLQNLEGWIYYKFTIYYVSNDTGKNWSESRRDCKQRGADLVIINSKQEQDFVMNFTRGKECWIGLTDSDKEGTWKWVDGTNVTSVFWASGEPNGRTSENCAVSYLTRAPALIGWIDETCSRQYQWICEKSISHLIQP